MKHYKFICLGPPGVGKTEYGLRLIRVLGTSGISTYKSNSFSVCQLNTFINDPLVEEQEKLWIAEEEVSAEIFDLSGQRHNADEIGAQLGDTNGGIIHIIDGIEKDFDFLLNTQRIVKEESLFLKESYESEGKSFDIPPISVYLNKAVMEKAEVTIDDLRTGQLKLLKKNDKAISIEQLLYSTKKKTVKGIKKTQIVTEEENIKLMPEEFNESINGLKELIKKYGQATHYQTKRKLERKIKNYNSITKSVINNESFELINKINESIEDVSEGILNKLFKFCKENNASFYCGDSVGPDKNNPEAEIYCLRLIKNADEPAPVNYDGLLSGAIIKEKLKTRRGLRSLEKNVRKDLESYSLYQEKVRVR